MIDRRAGGATAQTSDVVGDMQSRILRLEQRVIEFDDPVQPWVIHFTPVGVGGVSPPAVVHRSARVDMFEVRAAVGSDTTEADLLIDGEVVASIGIGAASSVGATGVGGVLVDRESLMTVDLRARGHDDLVFGVVLS